MPGVPSLITSLRTFSGVPFFGMDEMHLISRGIGQLLFSMLEPRSNSKFRVESADNYTFQFRRLRNSTITMTTIGQQIKLSKPRVPLLFEGCWDDQFGLYRAVDWQDFLTVVVPLIILSCLEDDNAKEHIMNLVNGCILALERVLSSADLIEMERYCYRWVYCLFLIIKLTCQCVFRYFKKWHDFLRSQIAMGRINERVFTINNHYLSHIKYIIQEMGPLRYISCRTSERRIKRYTNIIKSTVKPGVNASNVLINEQSTRSYGISETMGSGNASVIKYRPDSFLVHPSGDVNAPQLWEPHGHYQTLADGRICGGLPDADVLSALQSYYARLFGDSSVVLSNTAVKVAQRLWLDSTVMSSKLYRTRRRLSTRADNFVLFEAGRYRRYWSKRNLSRAMKTN